MTFIIDGTAGETFPDSSVQATSALVAGKTPYANLPAGSVIQVVQGSTNAATSVSTGTFTATNLSATITPRFNTSKILILMTNSLYITRGSATDVGVGVGIYRNGGAVYVDNGAYVNFYYSSSSVGNIRNRTPLNYLDSPASTSSLTYTLYIAWYGTAGQGSNAALNTDSQYSFITLMEIAA